MGVGKYRIKWATANLDWQHTGGMCDLLRKIDLEMTGHLATLFTPLAHGGKSRIFDKLPTSIE